MCTQFNGYLVTTCTCLTHCCAYNCTLYYIYIVTITNLCIVYISTGTVDQCILAIGHIAKIIKAKASLLCTASKNRRVPRYTCTCSTMYARLESKHLLQWFSILKTFGCLICLCTCICKVHVHVYITLHVILFVSTITMCPLCLRIHVITRLLIN